MDHQYSNFYDEAAMAQPWQGADMAQNAFPISGYPAVPQVQGPHASFLEAHLRGAVSQIASPSGPPSAQPTTGPAQSGPAKRKCTRKVTGAHDRPGKPDAVAEFKRRNQKDYSQESNRYVAVRLRDEFNRVADNGEKLFHVNTATITKKECERLAGLVDVRIDWTSTIVPRLFSAHTSQLFPGAVPGRLMYICQVQKWFKGTQTLLPERSGLLRSELPLGSIPTGPDPNGPFDFIAAMRSEGYGVPETVGNPHVEVAAPPAPPARLFVEEQQAPLAPLPDLPLWEDFGIAGAEEDFLLPEGQFDIRNDVDWTPFTSTAR